MLPLINQSSTPFQRPLKKIIKNLGEGEKGLPLITVKILSISKSFRVPPRLLAVESSFRGRQTAAPSPPSSKSLIKHILVFFFSCLPLHAPCPSPCLSCRRLCDRHTRYPHHLSLQLRLPSMRKNMLSPSVFCLPLWQPLRPPRERIFTRRSHRRLGRKKTGARKKPRLHQPPKRRS